MSYGYQAISLAHQLEAKDPGDSDVRHLSEILTQAFR